MLGKLTRWLRMIGCDVEYFNDLDDEELIETAAKEERILLTRDIQLYRRASVNGVEAFLIRGQTETEKLADLAKRFDIKLEIDVNNSRCPKCNTKIDPVSKEKIKDKVPQSTSRFYEEFWICPKCDQIYWRGSHWKKINRTLLEAKRMMELSMKLKRSS
jgi:uncharacterized protein with PIN domain